MARLWAKIDCLFFEETGDLTMAQQVAFLRLILHCKRHRNDGHFGAAALKVERISKAALSGLIEHKDGYVEHNGDGGYVIPNYTKWQGTSEELSAKRAEAGKRGAEKRWGSE